MQINQEGIDLIKHFEGCKLTAYKCPANVWTIGFGHTAGVKEGMVWTQEQVIMALKNELTKFERGVTSLVKSKLNENQFSALVSFAYNCGLGAFNISTLLKLVNKNPHDLNIANEFKKWNKANGVVLAGLVKRREAESKLYFKK